MAMIFKEKQRIMQDINNKLTVDCDIKQVKKLIDVSLDMSFYMGLMSCNKFRIEELQTEKQELKSEVERLSNVNRRAKADITILEKQLRRITIG